MSEPAESIGAFDYVIVGGGSAGCVLANRLSKDPSISVALIEAGGDNDTFWVHTPVGLGLLLQDSRYNWAYRSAPEPFADSRETPVPRGKGLGGSSSINAMIYIRGVAQDYDLWRQYGNPGWSWDDVLPYFKKFEDHPHPERHPAHSAGGELGITETPQRYEILGAWTCAAVETGIPETDDFNRGDNEGVGPAQATIKGGRRRSAAEAFLRPVLSRRNLHVVTNAQATRLLFDGRRVTGVEYAPNGGMARADASCEVVVAAGAIGSPQLLQLSGVGPADVLARCGVEMRHALPGVGENMQDHWQLRLTWSLSNTITFNQWYNNPLRRYAMGAQYLATRGGPMSAQPPQVLAFTRTEPSYETPNIQFHVSPYSSDAVGGPLHKTSGFSNLIAVLNPRSYGHSHIRTGDFREAPSILHNFLATAESHRVAIDTIRLARRIMAQKAVARFAPVEMTPGPDVRSDDEILAFARHSVMTTFHQSCTCKMGPQSDAMAVVDERLRVRGLDGLRIVDASIMPLVPSGNTNAPTMMIAEKGADMILADRRARRA